MYCLLGLHRQTLYWGEEHLPSDQLIHTLGFPELSRQWLDQHPAEFQGYFTAFARGMNDYAAAHPEVVDPAMQVVLPLEAQDVMAHALFFVCVE